jgi:cation transport regulator ChaB
MSHDDDLPAQVRRQDEEAERQIAAQLAELRTGTETTHQNDLPAEIRRQDEQAERQVAAQLAELRMG